VLRRGSIAQLLAAPVLEDPLAAAGVAVVVVVVDVSLFEDVSLFGLLSLALAAAASPELSLFFAPPLLLYRSAYQPPPLRMKPAPPETWRLAEACLQLGHSVSGAALMDCSASQAWPQAVQAYS
jgi:hypothetical protein